MASLSQIADHALSNLEAYAVAHLNMASAAERVVNMVAEGAFTASEAIESLTMFVSQYQRRLAELDAKAGR